MQARFDAKKKVILDRLAQPINDYTDASPKGSVDESIRDLVEEINNRRGFVTTSSCSGRVAAYLEGSRQPQRSALSHDTSQPGIERNGPGKGTTSSGGKGGGKWLFTSHEPVDLSGLNQAGVTFSRLGFQEDAEICYPSGDDMIRFVHFKFEPMILHILTSSIENAQLVLNAATSAGFRESGISGVMDSKGQQTPPMVAVRSSGQATDAVIGFFDANSNEVKLMVSEPCLRTYLEIATARFRENVQRTARFQEAFLRLTSARTDGSSIVSQSSHREKMRNDLVLSDKQRRKGERKAESKRFLDELRNREYDTDLCSGPDVNDGPEDSICFILDQETNES